MTTTRQRRRKYLVYISGPYSRPDPVRNTAIACEWWRLLRAEGYTPICPHLSMLLHFHAAATYDDWLEYDCDVLRRCDAVVRIAGESKGADLEVAYARRQSMPVIVVPVSPPELGVRHAVVELDSCLLLAGGDAP